MPEVIKSISSDDVLRKEPKAASDIELQSNGEPLEVKAGDKVKAGTGTKPDAEETTGGKTTRWVFIESADGKKKGYVAESNLVDGDVEASAGFVPLPLEVERADFAATCFTQAARIPVNPAYLFALAFTQSGSQWSKTHVKATDAADATAFGVFQFTKATWKKLQAEPDLSDFTEDDIKFPALQCIAAGVLAEKAASAFRTSAADRDLSAVDLFLAHLFAGADDKFGAESADKILKADKNQKVGALIEQIFPDATARAAFLKRTGDIFDKDAPSVEEALKRCAAKLDAGFDQLRGLGAEIEASIPSPGASSLSGTVINVTDEDVEALARVAHSEVGGFGVFGDDVLTEALAAVVDTILVRVVYPTKEFPKTIQGVINQKQQFSAINPLGTWKKLPEAPAKNRTIVLNHVQNRAKGTASKIKGATHFFNPDTSFPKWGQPIRDNPVATYGKPKNSHIHGFPTGYRPPGDYAIQFGSDAFGFTGDGQPKGKFTAPDTSPNSIVAAAFAEWEVWGKSVPQKIGHKDDEITFATYAFDTYCKPLNSTVASVLKIQTDKYPWSAVCVSYILRQAGLTKAQFTFAESHSVYIREAIKARKDGNKSKAYWGFRVNEPEAVLAVGDIVGAGRAKGITPAQAQALFDNTGDYESHSDIVVAVRSGTADLIGGNVSELGDKEDDQTGWQRQDR